MRRTGRNAARYVSVLTNELRGKVIPVCLQPRIVGLAIAGLVPGGGQVRSPSSPAAREVRAQSNHDAFARRTLNARKVALLLMLAGSWPQSALRAEDAPRRVLMLHAF